MTSTQKRESVGSADPDLKTSPILEERGEDFDVLLQEMEDMPCCYFNSVSFDNGSYVCSGSGVLLHCDKGIWIRSGGCDPDNP